MLAPQLGHAWEWAGTAVPHSRQEVSDIVGEGEASGGEDDRVEAHQSNPTANERKHWASCSRRSRKNNRDFPRER